MVSENGNGRRVGERATFPQPCPGDHSKYWANWNRLDNMQLQYNQYYLPFNP